MERWRRDIAKTEEMTGLERVYNFIVKFITENCYSPSIREICEGAKLRSKSSVYEHLMELELMGKIEMRRNAARTIRLVGYKMVKVDDSANGNG